MPSGVFIDGWWYPKSDCRWDREKGWVLKRPKLAPSVTAVDGAVTDSGDDPQPEAKVSTRYSTKIVKAGEDADDKDKASGSDSGKA